MDTLTADFEKRCEVVETAAIGTQANFQSETLMLRDETGKETELTLSSVMEDFIQLFKSSKERLDQLWAEYEQTQRSIMELALAVLNDDRVRIKYSSLDAKSDAADPRLDEVKAQKQRAEAQHLYDEVVGDLDNLKQGINSQAKKSLTENDKILSVSVSFFPYGGVADAFVRILRSKSRI